MNWMNKIVVKKFLATFTAILLIVNVSSFESVALSAEKMGGIRSMAEKFNLPFEDVESRLHFNENCYLVPLLRLDEHKNCLIDIFANSNPHYMRYYLSGRLRTPKQVENVYFNGSLNRMWGSDKFSSLNFIIDCDDVSIGRIAVGPLRGRRGVCGEVGYALKEEYSGRGLMTASVNTLIGFLKYILNVKGNDYNFTRIRATAKQDNAPSNKILSNIGFVKSHHLINDGYGPENEYFYYFNN